MIFLEEYFFRFRDAIQFLCFYTHNEQKFYSIVHIFLLLLNQFDTIKLSLIGPLNRT